MTTAPVRKTVQLPSAQSEKRLKAIPGRRDRQLFVLSGEWLYRGTVLLLLAAITSLVSRPSALQRCIDQRIAQVLESHNLKSKDLSEAVRISETTKATNFCNGGNGQLNWIR